MNKSAHFSKLVPRRPSLSTPRLLSLLLWTGRLTPGSIGLPAGQQSIAMPVLFPHGTGRVSRVFE